MLIQAKDLPHALKRGLARFYFLFGEEPLQRKEACDILRTTARANGFTEREVFDVTPSFDWEWLLSSLNTSNLFGAKRFIECRLPESPIGKVESAALLKLAQFPIPQDVTLLLIANKIESKLQQSHWFSSLQSKGSAINARMLSPEENFRWLEQRLLQNGLHVDPENVGLLFERTEGNLLAAAQAIEKLKLHADGATVTTEDILQGVSIDARFTVFDLVDAALAGATQRTTQILLSLKEEGTEPMRVLWALAKEVRSLIQLMYKLKNNSLSSALLQEHGIWKRKEAMIKAFIQRSSIGNLQAILLQLKTVDDIVKGRALGNAWNTLFSACHRLTGAGAL